MKTQRSKSHKTASLLHWIERKADTVTLIWKWRYPGAKAVRQATFSLAAWPSLWSDQWVFLLRVSCFDYSDTQSVDRWHDACREILPQTGPTHTDFNVEFGEEPLPTEFENMELTDNLLKLLDEWQEAANAQASAEVTLSQAHLDVAKATEGVAKAQIRKEKIRWMLDYLKTPAKGDGRVGVSGAETDGARPSI